MATAPRIPGGPRHGGGDADGAEGPRLRNKFANSLSIITLSQPPEDLTSDSCVLMDHRTSEVKQWRRESVKSVACWDQEGSASASEPASNPRGHGFCSRRHSLSMASLAPRPMGQAFKSMRAHGQKHAAGGTWDVLGVGDALGGVWDGVGQLFPGGSKPRHAGAGAAREAGLQKDREKVNGPANADNLKALFESLSHCSADALSDEQVELLRRLVAVGSRLVDERHPACAAADAGPDRPGADAPARPPAAKAGGTEAVRVPGERAPAPKPRLPDSPQRQADKDKHADTSGRPRAAPPQAPGASLQVPEASVPATPASLDGVPKYFKQFLDARCIPEVEESFKLLLQCSHLRGTEVRRTHSGGVPRPYSILRTLAGIPWKAAKIWQFLDAQVAKEDHKGEKLQSKSVVVVGAGPVGLRLALEASLSGATVTVLEKRDSFERINRLHLWEWVKQDLCAWGAKLFSPPGGTFGSDKDYCHIGISELQILMLKCCLLLGVTVELGVEFVGTNCEATGDWFVQTKPPMELQVDALVCCDGAASLCGSAYGFKAVAGGLGKEGQSIGIVSNFVNTRSRQERDLRQFSWARQFNMPLFRDLQSQTGAQLQNIVYYRGDNTHYVIMTPSKQCLVDAGCIKSAEPPDVALLHPTNLDMVALQGFATRVVLHFGLPTTFTPTQSVMIFDFSDTKRHDQPVNFAEAPGGKPLPVCLAGDALLEPFWPTGLGCIRGFLGALDVIAALQIWFSTQDQKRTVRYSEAAYTILKSVDTQTKDTILKPEKEWRLPASTRYRGFPRGM